MTAIAEFTVTLELLDYWHAGSSRGRGPVYDAEVVRSPEGLPYLPVRSLRGLLREGMVEAEGSALTAVPEGTVAAWFGADDAPGRLRVGNATLEPAVVAWARSARDDDARAVDGLYHTVAATAIDPETGTARDKTLRVVEVAVPVTLHAAVRLEGPSDPAADPLEALRSAAGFVRGLGKSRRRGLGRVRVSVDPVGEEARP